MKNNNNWQVFLQNSVKASQNSNHSDSHKAILKISSIGVNVAKDKLDICLLLCSNSDSKSNSKPEAKFLQITNSQKEINLFFKFLQELNFAGKIVLEPTSIYHLNFYEIGLTNDFSVSLCNPQKAKQFSKFWQGNKKSDKTDSLVLAKLAESDLVDESGQNEVRNARSGRLDCSSKTSSETSSETTSKAKTLPNKNQLLVNQLRSLSKTKQVLSGQLKHMEKLVKLNVLQESELAHMQQSLENIEEQMSLIEHKIEADITQNFDQKTLQKLQEIPGISKRITALLLALCNPNYSLNSWLGYTGSCPENQQSGTSLNKNGSISKKGNRMLRVLLYHMGFGAGVHKYGFFRKMYEKLKEKGRCHLEATLIVGKKVLRIFYAVLTKNTSFDPQLAKPI